jgi:hypothetical protein
MNRRLFFLKHDGWFEEALSGKLLHATQEELVLWAYAMMERKNYRNYLITEKPEIKYANYQSDNLPMVCGALAH